MSQQYRYPNSASVTVAAVGTNGAAIPTQSILIGGEDNLGNLTPIAVDTDGNVQVDIVSVPLPPGAATSANQLLEIGELQDIEADVEAMSAKLPATLGQKAMAASLAVAIASDQSAIPASQSGTWNINNISGTVVLPTGASTSANQTTMINSLSSIDSKNPALVGGKVPVDASGTTVTVQDAGVSGSSVAAVASSASSITILASNASRKGATVTNDSTQVLYLKFGATASSASYTVKLTAGSYYEVPFQYTGVIDGIWASANGNALVTELT